MQGNVWQFVNDWYETNYYSVSPYDNPWGPDTGSPGPDGKAYRNMRGGNWYNGLAVIAEGDAGGVRRGRRGRRPCDRELACAGTRPRGSRRM